MNNMNNRLQTAMLCSMALLVTMFAPPAGANGIHPEVPLLDADRTPVMQSGLPLSTMETCGGDCHDTAYIMSGSDHADAGMSELGQAPQVHPWQQGPGYFGGWNTLSYDTDGLQPSGTMDTRAWLKRFGARHTGGGPVAEYVEMDCLLCHTSVDNTARKTALENGDFAWANSAPLSALGALSSDAGQWQWDAAKFQSNGALVKGLLDIHGPRVENCAQCHGMADISLQPGLTIPADIEKRHNTERTGQIISPQKLLNTGLNVADKQDLDFPFDVHTDRVVGCTDCHYSLNNPVYFRQSEASRPAHLDFDPRRMGNAAYLKRPLHQFAKGKSTLGLAATESENSLRRCESCHAAGSVHQWLPYKQRHFASLACEACHVPSLYGPGLQSIDWTMLDPQAQPLRKYRDVDGDPVRVDNLIRGFKPLLLPRANKHGEYRLAPFNLVTGWYWVAGDPGMPVSRQQLQSALFADGAYRPELLAALDYNGDGQLLGKELQLDNEQAVAAVRQRLQAIGLDEPRVQGEITPFSISHDVVGGRWATRDCSTCHDRDSIIAAGFTLSAYQPGGVQPQTVNYEGVRLTGDVVADPHGLTRFIPDAKRAGFYIIGLNSQRWADLLGLVMFLAVTLGVVVHATGRYLAARRRPADPRAYKRVYMYDSYERLWHWLQASVILLLLFTGLVIHKPHFFAVFSFPYMVSVHNVLGFILLINAALALFYNLASGEIRQYLPEPKGFVARSLAQAAYYSRGIFAGQPHPLEKTKENKLNPLQQVTYLAILNILLPAQVLTGVMIWGLQRWPGIATDLGGLPVLAVVHTLIAWTFATFVVMHVYLTTAAGHTPAAGIKAMIEGWDEVEEQAGGITTDNPQGEM